jgi:hypothetical protein
VVATGTHFKKKANYDDPMWCHCGLRVQSSERASKRIGTHKTKLTLKKFLQKRKHFLKLLIQLLKLFHMLLKKQNLLYRMKDFSSAQGNCHWMEVFREQHVTKQHSYSIWPAYNTPCITFLEGPELTKCWLIHGTSILVSERIRNWTITS